MEVAKPAPDRWRLIASWLGVSVQDLIETAVIAGLTLAVVLNARRERASSRQILEASRT